MLRRVTSTMLVLCLALTLLPTSVLAATPLSGSFGENVTWTLDSGTLFVSGAGDMENYSANTAPWNKNRTAVKEIIIQSGVTSIGDYTFMGCDALSTVRIPDSVTRIGRNAFGFSGLTSITIPNSVTEIESGTFNSCTQLSTAILPEGITTIGSSAFYNCTSLTDITLPNSVTNIGRNAFLDCSNLANVSVGNKISEVGMYAFSGCISLSSFTTPVGLTTIDEGTFRGCSGLQNIAIPSSVTTIKKSAFANCDKLTDVYFEGSAAKWKRISFYDGNSCLTDAVIHYGQTTPETSTQKYTVSYDLADGSGGPSVGSYAAGAEVTIPTTVPVKDGYIFTGWSDGPAIYKPGQSFTMLDQNVTLVAQWEEKKASAIDDSSVFFIPQSDDKKCTLASAAMMLKRRAILDGLSDWESITETSVGNSSWTNDGLKTTFEYRGMYTTAYVGANVENMVLAERKKYFISQLSAHPEGIVVYRKWDGKQEHAVLLTSYDAEADIFYCADPAGSTKGIVPLVDSTIGVNKDNWELRTQDKVLSVLTQVWIITRTHSQKTLVSSSVSAHCPVDMAITIGGETLDSRTVASREQNTYAEMSCSEVNGEKNIDVDINGNYVIRQDTDIKLYGSDSGSMTFEVKHHFSDGTSETHTFKDVPLTSASVGSATGIYPQSTVLLFMQEPAEEAETVWAASPNETVTEPCTDFGELPSAGNNNNSNSNPSISTNPYSPGIGGFAPSYSITVPSSIAGGTVTVSPTSASTGSKVTITATPSSGYELSTLTATDSSGKVLTLINEGNGKYSFTMPSGKVSIDATFRAVETPWSNPFTDVSTGAWYYDAIKFVNQNGLMNGVGNGRFAPGTHLSRSMLAEILYNKEGRPAVTAASSFSDVGAGVWYTDAVTWAAANNIVGGYGNGRFDPGDDITREQFAVILYRYAGSPIPPNLWLDFTDAYKVSDWAQDAVRWAVDQGIIKGKDNGILDPTGKATRAETAQMLKNYFGK